MILNSSFRPFLLADWGKKTRRAGAGSLRKLLLMLPALARLVQFAFPTQLKETRERERRNVIVLAPYRRNMKKCC